MNARDGMLPSLIAKADGPGNIDLHRNLRLLSPASVYIYIYIYTYIDDMIICIRTYIYACVYIYIYI